MHQEAELRVTDLNAIVNMRRTLGYDGSMAGLVLTRCVGVPLVSRGGVGLKAALSSPSAFWR